MITIPAALGLMTLAPEIIATLFQRGAFEESDTQALVPILMICAAGMPFYGFVSIETRALYAIKDARTPVRGSAIALVVNIVLSITLLKFLIVSKVWLWRAIRRLWFKRYTCIEYWLVKAVVFA